jgi:hypothetical protein
VAVLSCAGAYVSGAAGSNDCPAGSARIETEAACRTAAAAAGKMFVAVASMVDYSHVPRGCFTLRLEHIFEDSDDVACFNAHAVGDGHPDARLLCAGARVPTARVLTGHSEGTQEGVLEGYSHNGYSRGTQMVLTRVLARVLARVLTWVLKAY